MPTVAGTAYPIADCVLAGVSPTNDAIPPIASPVSSLFSALRRFTAMPNDSFPGLPNGGGCACARSASVAHRLPCVLDHRLVLIPRPRVLFLPDSPRISVDGRPWAASERLGGGQGMTETECRREAVVRD